MHNVKKKEGPCDELFFCFMEVYLNLLKTGSFDVDVSEGFEDVSDVRCAGEKNSDGFFIIFFVGKVLEEVQSGGHAPILDVPDLIDYLHLNIFE